MMFVDGIVLLANTEKGLQESLNGLEEFCSNWDLSINIEIVVFNKPTCSSQFFVYNSLLEQVKEYKYLGIMLSDRSLFKQTPTVLAKQANKSLFSLMKKLNNIL